VNDLRGEKFFLVDLVAGQVQLGQDSVLHKQPKLIWQTMLSKDEARQFTESGVFRFHGNLLSRLKMGDAVGPAVGKEFRETTAGPRASKAERPPTQP